ncbi:hypothetical protein JI739_10360 [Ramlibacter sp. AW1]|uniref:Uncharacterized protein n=1 Tax=Ramlibacter aurantiacus TaxID=2801330 RepID=A0A936ZQN1_9BURK|nr:hypothetical protein [Ramlibacter aurantiacus]MBL0420746.1 hypothetical protein [Ramlibacter aurantiacus]
MRRPSLLLLPGLLLGLSGWASGDDPLASERCVQALQRLDALRQQAAAPQAVEAARQRAAQACLEGPAPGHPVPRSPQPPVRVAPVAPTPAPAVAPPITWPPAPLAVERPSVVTSCDATGCWDADGRRLNRVGPELHGPRGPCMPMGSTFVCP